jgi:hypothetical protein
MFLSYQDLAFSEPAIPVLRSITPGSIAMEFTVTKEMLRNDYYYRFSYETSGNFPIWTVFYWQERQDHMLAYSSDQITRLGHNRFSAIDTWHLLKIPGPYLLTLMTFNTPFHPQEIIQTVRISSNTRKALEDRHTLIVNDSTGVAPQKGTADFKIRYQLNETSNMVHKILRSKDNHTEWEQEIKNVQRGTRGFDWDCRNATKDKWYRAFIEAKSVIDAAKWDTDLSRKFKALR